MAYSFRDTFAGQVVRLVSRRRCLTFPEEKNRISAQLTLERSISGTPSGAGYRQWTNHVDGGMSDGSKAELGGNSELVSWSGPDDPAVSLARLISPP
jgi:hypothetical protein